MFRKRHPKVGARPGTLMINGASPTPVIRVIQYTPTDVTEHEVKDVQQLREMARDGVVTWIDVQGFGDEETIRAIGDIFGLHPLALEDVVNVPQRPKTETFDDHLFWISRMAMPVHDGAVQTEQVSLVLGRNHLLTFQERYGDVLDPVRIRIRQGKGPIRKAGPDYLAYAILDAIIDGFYPILESFGEYLERLEEGIMDSPHPGLLHKLHRVKRELLAIRRAVWPQRELVSELVRGDSEFVSAMVCTYLRDVYDHCVQIIDVVETYRELTGGLMDVYLSSIGNRQNEVMKVLTIMASIFIPLTFMAGIYGMNFENMPELHGKWAYPILLLAMLLVALGMIIYFRRKGWLSTTSSENESRDTES
ncbi:MAG: magnesium/cobalt transporter CorA [Phycisphaerae bacterium]|jgi:magnesium transporter